MNSVQYYYFCNCTFHWYHPVNMKKHCFCLNQINSRVIYRRSLSLPAALGVSQICVQGQKQGNITFEQMN